MNGKVINRTSTPFHFDICLKDEVGSRIESVKVFGMSGREVVNKKVSCTETACTIEFEDALPKGLYVVHLVSKEGLVSRHIAIRQ